MIDWQGFMENQQLWIEPIGNIIIARLRGVPSEEVLKQCQERVLLLVQDTKKGRVLYDALELLLPTVDPAIIQRDLNEALNPAIQLRSAIVVPNTRIAYLARLAFGEGDCRIFYNDFAAAIQWLEQ